MTKECRNGVWLVAYRTWLMRFSQNIVYFSARGSHLAGNLLAWGFIYRPGEKTLAQVCRDRPDGLLYDGLVKSESWWKRKVEKCETLKSCSQQRTYPFWSFAEHPKPCNNCMSHRCSRLGSAIETDGATEEAGARTWLIWACWTNFQAQISHTKRFNPSHQPSHQFISLPLYQTQSGASA